MDIGYNMTKGSKMKKYIIKLDEKYLCGTHDDIFYKIEGGFNNGFHQGENCYINKLILGHEKSHAIEIEGKRNLKSWIDKIMVRHDAGFIKFKEFIIEVI
jgi:hypothetical protein